MHPMNADSAHEEKAWRQLHKNTMGIIEQDLEVTSHKILPVQPPTTHLENYSN